MNFLQGKINWKYILIILAVAIVLGTLMLWKIQELDYFYQLVSPAPTSEQTSPDATTGTTLSYTKAVNLYADRRIQFDNNCVVTPNYITFKKGTAIMLDNRAPKDVSVSLDSTKYSLKAYGFKIITLTTTATLPHTIMVDCGSGQNNGRILLQQ